MKTELLVGELAKVAGVTADTIRFYEKHGLLPEPARTGAGYRLYDRQALRRVRFIRQAQSIGFSLAEIRRILNLRGGGAETCRCVVSIAEATLEETERKIRELRQLRDSLRSHLERWKGELPCDDMAGEFCALIEETMDSSEGELPQEESVTERKKRSRS